MKEKAIICKTEEELTEAIHILNNRKIKWRDDTDLIGNYMEKILEIVRCEKEIVLFLDGKKLAHGSIKNIDDEKIISIDELRMM